MAKSDPAAVTRDYVFKVDAGADGAQPPVLSVYGGKLTTYRKLAEAAIASSPVLPRDAGAWTANGAAGRRSAGAATPPRVDLRLRVDIRDARSTSCGRSHAGTGRCADACSASARLADLGETFGAGLTEREVDYWSRDEWARTRRRRAVAAHQVRLADERGRAVRARVPT